MNDQIKQRFVLRILVFGLMKAIWQIKFTWICNLVDVQVQEERAHAMGMFDFVYLEKEMVCVKLEAIGQPQK